MQSGKFFIVLFQVYLVGLPIFNIMQVVKPFKDKHRGLVDAMTIIDGLGDFKTLDLRCPARYAARLSRLSLPPTPYPLKSRRFCI